MNASDSNKFHIGNLDKCLQNKDAPPQQQIQNMEKVLHLDLPHPQGHVMSVSCEQPLDELTVQGWLLCHHPSYECCTLFVSGTELWMDRQTDGWSEY